MQSNLHTLKMKNCEIRWIGWWPQVYSDNWTWRQIDKVLKDKQKKILKMERSMEGLRKPHFKIWCWIDAFWEQKKGLRGKGHFYHKKWYSEMYGLGVFKEGTIIDDDFHEERCSQLLIWMSGCSILLSHNLRFKIIEIKTEQDFYTT